MRQHVSRVCADMYFHLRRLRAVRRQLSRDVSARLVTALLVGLQTTVAPGLLQSCSCRSSSDNTAESPRCHWSVAGLIADLLTPTFPRAGGSLSTSYRTAKRAFTVIGNRQSCRNRYCCCYRIDVMIMISCPLIVASRALCSSCFVLCQ